MASHLQHTECPRCGTIIVHDELEDPRCECGWDLNEDFEDSLRDRCNELEEDYDRLLEELDGDMDMMDSYLHILERDD
jgi:hypothetical protein